MDGTELARSANSETRLRNPAVSLRRKERHRNVHTVAIGALSQYLASNPGFDADRIVAIKIAHIRRGSILASSGLSGRHLAAPQAAMVYDTCCSV